MSGPVCIICRKGVANGLILHRVNAKGQPGIWACRKHVGQTDAPPVDPEMNHLLDVIRGAKP